jgi:iron complex outermembrane receptor protein
MIVGLAAGAVCGPVVAQVEGLDEIVVTATRQSDRLNRVPLAVTAETQRSLDQRGIQTIADLQAAVPSLRLTGFREGSGVATVAIRSVSQAAGTSATTGFYLDETSMQKRSSAGFGSLNGTPIPPLFDLERVEVLRGPQGTLFGGGSEGGTIRYLQPQPGLTDYTAYGRAQLVTTRGGDPGFEAGIAFGGPILKDKLGFRASIFGRRSGGWTDLTDFRNGKVYDENANSGEIRMGRFALAWAPTDSTLLTLSYFTSTDETDHVSSTYSLDLGQVTVPSLCYDVNALVALPLRSGPRSNPQAFAAGPDCNGRAGEPGIYVAPGYTLGPLDLERDQSLVLGPTTARTRLDVASADFQWDLTDTLSLRSITSYVHDESTGTSPQNFHQGQVGYNAAGGATYVIPGGLGTIIVPSGVAFNPNVTSTANGLGLGAYLKTNSRNSRSTVSQEVRIASTGESRLTYVAGAYFADTRGTINQRADASNEGFVQMAGLSIEQRYGVPFQGFYANLQEATHDTETAVFGDATFRFNDHFRASAGVRVTYVTTTFSQTNFGPNGYTTQPSLQDGSLVTGRISDNPVTPRASLQYFITPEHLVYLSAAKGFRAGGVNPVFSSAGQTVLGLQYNLPRTILPLTYESDSVWNYELGAKFRLWDGRAQINTALYQIDWDNIQTSQFIGGDTVVFNVPKARSKGWELEAQVRPVRSLTFNAAVAYSTAEYIEGLSFAPGPGRTLPFNVAVAGQKFIQPKWTADSGVRYDLVLGGVYNAYARLDYRWTDGYTSAVPGSPNYTPDSSETPARRMWNLRLGFERDGLDVNVFALNLTDEDDGPTTGGRTQCTNVDCTTFNAYTIHRTISPPTPRQVGIQVSFRR